VLKVSSSGGTLFKNTKKLLKNTFKNVKPHSTVLKLSTKTLSLHDMFTHIDLLTLQPPADKEDGSRSWTKHALGHTHFGACITDVLIP
jgi:hypothetical protein